MDRKNIGKRRKQAVRGTFALGILFLFVICPLLRPIQCKAKSVVYHSGFSYGKLSKRIKQRISGVSYHKNPNVKYSDLRYVTVRYIDFYGADREGELIVNKRIAKKVAKIFYELYQIKYPIERIKLIDEYGADDAKSMAANNTSAFNYRKVAGSKKLSKHAYGLAIDINPRINPWVASKKVLPANGKVYANRNRKTCKGKYARWMIKKNDKIVKIFKKYGFTWGGDWVSLKDYQHFEL